MKQRATITALMTTYNAERFLRGCLESIKWVDEIIIADMFSTDRTVEIAREYGAKVIQDKEENTELRINLALDKAGSDWIMRLTVTERITHEVKNEILEIINKEGEYVGYHMPRLNYFYGKFIEERPGPLYLFKNGAGRYPGICGHEKVALAGKVGCLKNFKIHYSSITIKDLVDKANRYTSNDAKVVFAGHPRAFGCKFPVHRASLLNMTYRTIWGFFSMYIWGKGYKYGMHGLITSIICAFVDFMEIAKLWELEYKTRHNIKDELIPED